MPDMLLRLDHGALARTLAPIIREARTLVGWTQRELAGRASTSQATIWRLETDHATRLDLAVVERVLDALGIRGSLGLDARHLADRRRQSDVLHARLTGYVARRLGRQGWTTATEVPLGDGAPIGWIDLLAYRAIDRSLLIEESKTDLPDMGALQRSLTFYERHAIAAARRLGWRPVRAATVVVTLDTERVAERIRDNRDIVDHAFPATVREVTGWLADPGCLPPAGWAMVSADPASRRRDWLRAIARGGAGRKAAYAGYNDAVARLGIDPGGGRPALSPSGPATSPARPAPPTSGPAPPTTRP